MMRKLICLVILLSCVALSCAAQDLPSGYVTLKRAYPQFVIGYLDGYVLMADGTKIVYDDGKKKTFAEMLDDSDLEDMMASPYETDDDNPKYLQDVGRSRNEALFKSMYGKSAAEVTKRLVPVNWFGQKIQFTSLNNANKHLEEVAKELSNYPELKKYLTVASTFYWRKVRGANRQSAHSYGIAIDINTKYSDYWLWKNNGNNDEMAEVKYYNRIPLQIVHIFEKHGFVWGGRWYHFDTMHFEFRPELNPIVTPTIISR